MADAAPTSKTYDAVMIPRNMAGGGDLGAKLRRIDGIARPLMGWPASPQPGPAISPPTIYDCYFVRPQLGDTILFPTTHDRAREDRYVWTVRDDGVRLGILKPDPEPTSPTTA